MAKKNEYLAIISKACGEKISVGCSASPELYDGFFHFPFCGDGEFVIRENQVNSYSIIPLKEITSFIS